MRLSRIVLLPAAALFATACGVDDEPVVNARPQLSSVRVIHAIADEGPIDTRMIHSARWSNFALGLNFRASGIPMPVEPGSRPLRVWRSSTVLEEIVPLIETDVVIPAGQNVTLLLTGSVANGTARVEVIPDVVPDSTAGQIHARVVNATAAGVAASWVAGDVTSAPISVASLATSSYEARPAGPLSVLVGGATFAAPAGVAENNGIGATAGAGQAGSALSAFVFPASVVGSRAPQDGAFAAPAVVWMVDRVPAPPRN